VTNRTASVIKLVATDYLHATLCIGVLLQFYLHFIHAFSAVVFSFVTCLIQLPWFTSCVHYPNNQYPHNKHYTPFLLHTHSVMSLVYAFNCSIVSKKSPIGVWCHYVCYYYYLKVLIKYLSFPEVIPESAKENQLG